ncbi:MAG: hypothetical protein IJR14_07335 [Synergistaceae bacterium]|nr:hypothetical protein [Synergistaceae bacterium]
MKPRAKEDSWFWPATKTAARRRIRRLQNKRHRRADRAIVHAERAQG